MGSKTWQYKNRERHNAYQREYYHKNKERVNNKNLKWKVKNLIHYGQMQRQGAKARHSRLKDELLRIIGQNRCQMCFESDHRVLQFDHINGGGYLERKQYRGTSWYYYCIRNPELTKKNLQVLCANCNIRKYYDLRKKP